MGGKTTNTSDTKVDPAVQKLQFDNFDRSKDIADAPVTPYSGTLDLSASKAAVDGLMDFTAPQITAAQLNRGNIRDVSAGTVDDAAIGRFMNPYTDQVINATAADMEHARQVAQVNNNAKFVNAGAYGGTRQAVQAGVADADNARTAATTFANLRSQGFTTALSAAQVDAARQLQAAMANQGVDMSVEQANTLLEQQTAQANQQAAISGAGVKAQAAGLMGDMTTNEYQAALQEFLRQQQDPLVKQQLQNQSLSSVSVPQSTTQTQSYNPGLFDYAKVGAQVGSAIAMSDERLKSDIETVGYDHAGRRIVDFRYLWDEPEVRHRGHIAQELLESDPHAVLVHPAGFLLVNYGALA